MNYPFRVCGKTIEIHRYAVTYTVLQAADVERTDENGETYPDTEYTEVETVRYFSSEREAQAFAARCEGSVEVLDNSGYEWLDGIETPDVQNTFAEAVKIYEMGQAAYEERQSEKKDDLKTIRADIDFLAVMTGVEL